MASEGLSLARRERSALVETMRGTGPDAPTLCDGWTTRDLAAHLVVREARPEAAGVLVPALAARLESLRLVEAQRPWTELLEQIEAGPPWYSPLRIADTLANTAEYLVHHEDVRRAADGWTRRELDQADLDRLWTLSTLVARTKLRKVRARIDLCVPAASESTGAAPVSTGAALAPYVTVIADPVELLLWSFGRNEVDIEISGARAGIEALESVSRRV
ncbi:TIGR03085 family protein [Dietzia sp. NCCP-2495]|uniref:TIGR03085 family metal-binding protein n=1 Tax=Dietzia sp. NCCP-2495 TaxID=2934675 RepID=UPI00222E4CE1|nr:TIGR03085 family metal-binding protein [Dietzia sp. NCCP-2495]GLB62352.1 TIGR03085 family protein [Dietzia sp. NCCP-2495]